MNKVYLYAQRSSWPRLDALVWLVILPKPAVPYLYSCSNQTFNPFLGYICYKGDSAASGILSMACIRDVAELAGLGRL
jgi:hypothetical protein